MKYQSINNIPIAVNESWSLTGANTGHNIGHFSFEHVAVTLHIDTKESKKWHVSLEKEKKMYILVQKYTQHTNRGPWIVLVTLLCGRSHPALVPPCVHYDPPSVPLFM